MPGSIPQSQPDRTPVVMHSAFSSCTFLFVPRPAGVATTSPVALERRHVTAGPLDRDGRVAIENAGGAGAVQIQHAEVIDVASIGALIPGDAAGVFDSD